MLKTALLVAVVFFAGAQGLKLGRSKSKTTLSPMGDIPQLHMHHLRATTAEASSKALEQSEAACGVMIMAYGNPEGKHILNSINTIKKIRSRTVAPGWCKGDPSLTTIPVTFLTDLSEEIFHKKLKDLDVTLNHNKDFDPFDVKDEDIHKQWRRLGPPVNHWYHCQAFVHAPYDLMLYTDSDVAVCDVERLANLFREMGETGDDLAYENSNNGGHLMTYNNKNNPHPEHVLTSEDERTWAKAIEPNSGVVFFAKQHPVAQKWADDLCKYQRDSLMMDGVRGDQYSFRAANWENRNELKINIYDESLNHPKKNKVCRYKGRCGTGCAIVHGWKFPEVMGEQDMSQRIDGPGPKLPTPIRDAIAKNSYR